MNSKIASLTTFLKHKGLGSHVASLNRVIKEASGLSLLSAMVMGCNSKELRNEGSFFYWGVEKADRGFKMYNSALPQGWDEVKACYTDKENYLFDAKKLIEKIKSDYEGDDKDKLIELVETQNWEDSMWNEKVHPIIKDNNLYVMIYMKLTWKSEDLFDENESTIYIQKDISRPLGFPEDKSHQDVLSEIERFDSEELLELSRQTQAINIDKASSFKIWDGTPFSETCYIAVYPFDGLFMERSSSREFCSKENLDSDCKENFNLDKELDSLGINLKVESLFT